MSGAESTDSKERKVKRCQENKYSSKEQIPEIPCQVQLQSIRTRQSILNLPWDLRACNFHLS